MLFHLKWGWIKDKKTGFYFHITYYYISFWMYKNMYPTENILSYVLSEMLYNLTFYLSFTHTHTHMHTCMQACIYTWSSCLYENNETQKITVWSHMAKIRCWVLWKFPLCYKDISILPGHVIPLKWKYYTGLWYITM